MPGQSIFSDDWRDCLRAHYTHVIRTDDKGTEVTLRAVMREAGFTPDELKALYVEATMHVDNMPPDFIPDMELAAAEPAPEQVVQALVEEAAAVIDGFDAEEAEESYDDEPPPPADPGIVQLSLF